MIDHVARGDAVAMALDPGPHNERRLWERYPAGETPATLTWMADATDETVHGALLNLSGGGAAFSSRIMPPPDRPVWLRLGPGVPNADRVEPVECRLVRTTDNPSGAKVTHLEFVASCPLKLFEIARRGKG